MVVDEHLGHPDGDSIAPEESGTFLGFSHLLFDKEGNSSRGKEGPTTVVQDSEQMLGKGLRVSAENVAEATRQGQVIGASENLGRKEKYIRKGAKQTKRQKRKRRVPGKTGLGNS